MSTAFLQMMAPIAGAALALGASAGDSVHLRGEDLCRIGSISIERHDIFGTSDSTRLRRLGTLINAIHVLTKERVIRDELLFREGEVYDPTLVEESERNLRRLGFVGDVIVHADTMPDSSIHVAVQTQDKWTLGLSTSFKQDGGRRSYSLSVSEDNLLGSGLALSGGYNYDTQRSNPYGSELIFSDRRVLGTRWLTKLQYKDNEDLHIKTMLLESPFFADAAPWAGGLYVDEGRVRRRQYEGDVQVGQDDFWQQNQSAWLALSATGETILRPGLAFLRARTRSTTGVTARYDNLDLLHASLGIMRRTWYKGRFLNSIGRIEDVPLGFAGEVVAGRNFRSGVRQEPNWYFRLESAAAMRCGSFYLSPALTWSGYVLGSTGTESTLQWTLLAHEQLPSRNTVVVRLTGTHGHNWSPGKQVRLGSPSGLRGYGSYQFTGEGMLLANVEGRWRSNVEWWVFRFGGALFFDCGVAWREEARLAAQRLHSGAGFGLRVENTKQQGTGILRVDLAFNLDKRKFAELTITTGQLIEAFASIDYTPPSLAR